MSSSVVEDCHREELSLLDLPVEVVEIIVTHSSLSLVDIISLSISCTTVNGIISRSWRKIALTKWSWWSGGCVNFGGTNDAQWYILCKERYNCEEKLKLFLHQTISRGVRQYLTDDEEMECYGEMIANGTCSQLIFDCVLFEILNKKGRSSHLSYQYYGLCIYEYLKRLQLKEKWRDLFNQQQLILLIQGAVLISEWIDPFSCSSTEHVVESEICTIAELTSAELIGTSSTQSESDSVSQSAIPQLKSLKLSRNSILEALNNVMFKQLGYKAASIDYYQLENSLIEKVIERRRGIPITLSAVYQAAAHKLGVKLLPVNFPAHFLLKAETNHQLGEGEVFVDAYNEGTLLSQSECLNLIPFLSNITADIFKPVPTHRAIMRMVANIYSRDPFALNFDVGRHWLNKKWSPLVLPSSVSLQLHLCSICPVCDFTSTVAAGAAEIALDLRYNTKQVNRVMSDICNVLPPSAYVLTKLQRAQYAAEKRKKALNEATRVKHRDPSKVTYTVGMLMEHIRYDYRCVIYGWDNTCEMTEQWIQQMGVNQLPLGPAQPFYNVLVEDGTNRYAAQESLVPCPKEKLCSIVHWEVGKYFKEFTGQKYIPNHALLEKYPD